KQDDGGSLDDDPDEERDSASSCASVTDADRPIVRRRKTARRTAPSSTVPQMFETYYNIGSSLSKKRRSNKPEKEDMSKVPPPLPRDKELLRAWIFHWMKLI
ncbi:3924_t:CDS:2, partial [Funneliformis geosporum]